MGEVFALYASVLGLSSGYPYELIPPGVGIRAQNNLWAKLGDARKQTKIKWSMRLLALVKA